jgi:hypothetical protein
MLSLRDKFVCAMFILFSNSHRTRDGKIVYFGCSSGFSSTTGFGSTGGAVAAGGGFSCGGGNDFNFLIVARNEDTSRTMDSPGEVLPPALFGM